VNIGDGRAMNPINVEGNMFSNLFDKVPAKRAGVPEDIVATILYLASKAGVSVSQWAG
jgi:NAD(P)-dependent dehydrogenase (short-subunit alcohol dehydrogenase family)